MAIFNSIPDSSTTLSINYSPGQNKRLLASKSEAIFSFGDFTIEKQYSQNFLSSTTKNLSFSTFDNLETLGAIELTNKNSDYSVFQNELNLNSKDPKSYAYFSSFYTLVASSINKIINEYPYAILVYNKSDANIINYNEYYNGITFEKTSSFQLDVQNVINQGGINLSSGGTETFNLLTDFNLFNIQISGNSETYKIKSYSLSGNYLNFTIYGYLKNNPSGNSFNDAVYIRPTKERMYIFKNKLSNLENELLNEAVFSIPNDDSVKEADYINESFVWPKTIDGWAPDTLGYDFENYKKRILYAANKIDDEKTDVFIKTIIPENYIELDSENKIYRTLVQTYAYEFDKIKNYIDAFAYCHNIEYSGEETVPKKFMAKLGSLLGMELTDNFNELNLFEYLTSDLNNSDNFNSYSYFNIEIWRRILINLMWLYKKKGTRDAIMFIFKLIGAPDCLINFNEFIYEVSKTNSSDINSKIDYDGYINYFNSDKIFQEGGQGRGSGQDFINQWLPEFSPLKKVNNEKVETRSYTSNTRNVINSKEIELNISPAKAIENDIFEYYKNPCASWDWGSDCPAFSCLTTPFEYLTFSNTFNSYNITAMTLSDYIDHIFTNSVNPTNRKTNPQCHTTCSYQELKNIYLNYYNASCPKSNKLNNCKLESYLQLLEIQLGKYIIQLIPSTTIFNGGVPTLYKNTVFNRQKFVYREGIDSGSLFKREIKEGITANLLPTVLNNAKICFFAKQGIAKNGELDITGSVWRNNNKIPNSNICPSSKNIIVQSIKFNKNQDNKANIEEAKIKFKNIETNLAQINSVSLSCKITTNYLNSSIEIVDGFTTNIGNNS